MSVRCTRGLPVGLRFLVLLLPFTLGRFPPPPLRLHGAGFVLFVRDALVLFRTCSFHTVVWSHRREFDKQDGDALWPNKTRPPKTKARPWAACAHQVRMPISYSHLDLMNTLALFLTATLMLGYRGLTDSRWSLSWTGFETLPVRILRSHPLLSNTCAQTMRRFLN